MNAVQFDFIEDLLRDAQLQARELRCRLDDQPEMIGLSDIVLSRIEQALYSIRSSKEQARGKAVRAARQNKEREGRSLVR